MLKPRRVNINNKNNVETETNNVETDVLIITDKNNVLITTIRIMLKQRRVNNNNKNNVETETC